MKAHKCRRNGKLLADAMGWPTFVRPGEIVKVAGEDNWGRVVAIHECCTTADVEFAEGASLREPGITPMDPESLESVYRNRANAVPRGYPLPVHRAPKPTARAGRSAISQVRGRVAA